MNCFCYYLYLIFVVNVYVAFWCNLCFALLYVVCYINNCILHGNVAFVPNFLSSLISIPHICSAGKEQEGHGERFPLI